MNKKTISWIFKIAITVVFVFFVNRKIPLHELEELLQHITIPHIVSAFIFSMAGLYFQVKRWEIILKYQEFSVENNIAWKTVLWGNFLAFITPGRIGEVFRGLGISRKRKSDSILAVIVDKLFIILSILLTGLVCILLQRLFTDKQLTAEMMRFIVAAFLICAVGMGIITSGKVRERGTVISHYINTIMKSLPRLVNPAGQRAILFSFAAHGALLCQTLILLHMFGLPVALPVWIAIGQAYGVLLFFSFTIGNMGVREGSFNYFLSHLGIGVTTGAMSLTGVALGTSLIILIMNLVLPALAGLLWYFFRGFSAEKQWSSNG